MLFCFTIKETMRYVGSAYHEPDDLVKGERVRLSHYNYELLEDGHEATVVLGAGYLYVTGEDSNRYPGLKPKEEWRPTQKKKRKKSS